MILQTAATAAVNFEVNPGELSNKIVIIEDQHFLREALESLINATPDFVCAGSFGSMEDALARLTNAPAPPGVILCDIGLPGMSGIEGIKILKERFPDLIVLVLTVYDDDERIFDALCAGATGYLLKRTPSEKLVESIREAMAGGAPISPEAAMRVVKIFRDIRPPERAEYDLRPHELRLLKMLVEGHNYTTAAEKLGLSYNTVKFHMRLIYEKLQVHSKSEAVSKVLRERLIK